MRGTPFHHSADPTMRRLFVVLAMLLIGAGATASAEAARITAVFPDDLPETYVQQSGRSVAYTVNRALPADSAIELVAWTEASRIRTPLGKETNSPWRFTPDMLDRLAPGRTQLRLMLRSEGDLKLLATQWVKIVPPRSSPGSPPSSSNSGSPDGSASATKPPAPVFPTVHFPRKMSGKYQRGSGRDLPFVVEGKLPADGDVVVSAIDAVSGQPVENFGGRIGSEGPFVIGSKSLDKLPPGPTRLTLTSRKAGKVVDHRSAEVVVTPPAGLAPPTKTEGATRTPQVTPKTVPTAPSPEATGKPTPTPQAQVSPPSPPSQSETSANPGQAPQSEAKARPVSLTKPQTSGKPRIRQIPRVSFPPTTPQSYEQGSGADVPFRVSGPLPDSSKITLELTALDQHQAGGPVKVDYTGGPFRIKSDVLDQLPGGLVQAQLVTRFHGYVVQRTSHLVRIAPGADASAPTPGNANAGGDATAPGGNSGAHPIPGATNPPPSEPPANSGGLNHGGNGENDAPSSAGDASGGTETGVKTKPETDPLTDPESDPVTDPDVIPAHSNPFLGINLAVPRYYSANWTFTDVMKYNPKLYRGRYYAFRNIDGHYPHGKYTPTWDGDGTVKVEDIGNQIIITPKGDVRNLHVYMPGYGPGEKHWGEKFNRLFLKRMRPFSVIRFMDALDTNNSDIVKWSQRDETPMSIEDMIDLCNRLGADPWFNMPHKANADYVRHFARLVKKRLRPDLKVYVEYSNECWNSFFSQYGWLTKQKARLGADSQMEAAGILARRDFAIWTDVFAAHPDRVVRVAAGQTVNPWQVKQMIRGLGGDVDAGIRGDCDAIAITTYFGLHDIDLSADTTPKELIAASRREIQRVKKPQAEHGRIARKIGVPLIAYEGGSAINPNGHDVPWYDAYVTVERSDAMYDVYQDALKQFEAVGGSLDVAYKSSGKIGKFGPWGHLEYEDQPLKDAPRYRALIDYPTSIKRLELTSRD